MRDGDHVHVAYTAIPLYGFCKIHCSLRGISLVLARLHSIESTFFRSFRSFPFVWLRLSTIVIYFMFIDGTLEN